MLTDLLTLKNKRFRNNCTKKCSSQLPLKVLKITKICWRKTTRTLFSSPESAMPILLLPNTWTLFSESTSNWRTNTHSWSSTCSLFFLCLKSPTMLKVVHNQLSKFSTLNNFVLLLSFLVVGMNLLFGSSLNFDLNKYLHWFMIILEMRVGFKKSAL